MNKLPLEVALLISNHLSHREKQECALICHAWCTWFRSNGLFEKVSLHTGTDFNSVLGFFQDTYGKSAVNLSINVNTMTLKDFTRLPRIFPNVRKLHWVGEIPLNSNQDKKTFEMTVLEWRHIKAIDDGSTFHQIATVLLTSTSTASHIKNITLVYPIPEEEEEYDDDEYKNHIDPPLHLARNAQSLTAVNAPFTVSLLQRSRELIGQFNTLTLLNLDYSDEYKDELAEDHFDDLNTDAQYYLGEDELFKQEKERILVCQLRNVQHLKITVNLSKCELRSVHRWMNYFSETYPNLQSFIFECSDSDVPPIIDDVFDATFMYDRQMLKKFSVQFGHISQDLLEIMEEDKVALEDLTVFVDGQSLNQFGFLKESSQTKSLKKLTIKEREKYTINSVYGLDMFQLMERISQLEAVEIDTFRGSLLQHNPTVIVSILNSAPQLKSIKAPALMSQSSSENTVVSQPCELVHLDISYCQFKLATPGAQNINQIFKNILDKCPSLETFSTQVNAYKDETSTDTNIALAFSFTEQPDMKSIQIKSLYETYFKFIVNGKTTYYHQKHGEMRRPVPNVDETKVYIQIEARNASIIDTSVMSETP